VFTTIFGTQTKVRCYVCIFLSSCAVTADTWNPTSFNCLSPACKPCDYVYIDYVRCSTSSSYRLLRPVNCQTCITLPNSKVFLISCRSQSSWLKWGAFNVDFGGCCRTSVLHGIWPACLCRLVSVVAGAKLTLLTERYLLSLLTVWFVLQFTDTVSLQRLASKMCHCLSQAQNVSLSVIVCRTRSSL